MPGGGGIGGGALSPRTLIFFVAVLIVFFVFRSCFSSGGGGEATNFQAPPQPAAQSNAASQEGASSAASGFVDSASSSGAAEPFVPPPPSAEGTTWTVMLYQDADDKILEKDIFVDLNEAERIGSTDQVQVVAQVDRYRKGFTGDGNWDSTKRFHLTYDSDLNRVASQEVMDLGEVNMADGQTLVDFVTWAVENYPADRYALILSDHGMGWPGGWTDPDPGGKGPDRIALASALGDGTLAEYELFEWWSQMIEIPVVAEGALDETVIAQLSPFTDFFGIGEEIWRADNPSDELSQLIEKMSG